MGVLVFPRLAIDRHLAVGRCAQTVAEITGLVLRLRPTWPWCLRKGCTGNVHGGSVMRVIVALVLGIDRAAADMIAVRVTGPMKMAIVGAPTYFARRRTPRTPDDLAGESCIQYRLAVGGTLVWPLLRNGKTRRIAVEGRIMVNDTNLAIRAAVDGLGIAFTPEALAEPYLRSGQLVRVLEDWSPSFEGIFVYYPGHRQVPASLRAFIDMIRTTSGSVSARSSRKNPFATD